MVLMSSSGPITGGLICEVVNRGKFMVFHA